jgi:hypothetical protein
MDLRLNKAAIYLLGVISVVVYCTNVATAQLGGFGGGGLGGRGGGGRNQQQQTPEPKPTPPSPDDPLVHESTPPPPEAKLITKVGWCEVLVFGHTFSDAGLTDASLPVLHMHLAQRLEQLSRKLQFQPGKSGVQLMDSVDALVKFVYAKKDTLESGRSSKQPKQPVVAPAK